MAQVLQPSVAERAREALTRHAWPEAFDLLSEADGRRTLSADELELLAQASWWMGRLPAAIDARERAYGQFVSEGNLAAATRTAILLARDNLLRNAESVATAWLNRAERALAGSEEGEAHGWLAVTRAFQDGLAGRFEDALQHAERAYEIATRLGSSNLATYAMSSKGVALIYLGRVEEGLSLVDEATVTAVAGGIDPFTAGAVSCSTISACANLGDWGRAAQWTEAQDRWCQREQINGFPGMCRLHRAETKRLRGAWLEAEAEARRASDELQGFIPAAIGVALYEIGVIRLRRGDLPAAEDALLRAHSYGRDPEPALSLLRLAQGRVEEAQASIRRALEEPEPLAGWGTPPGSDLSRLSLLPAQAEIAVAAGDVATARKAADEMATLVETFPTTASKARSACIEGLVLLAEGRASDAVRPLRRSIQLWTELDAPWEAARARVALGSAYAALGDRAAAGLELRSARAAFEGLGAELDRRAVDDSLAALEAASGGEEPAAPAILIGQAVVPSTPVMDRTFMFTDIVDSTRFAELLGDEAWSGLLRWHDETLRSLVAQHGGEVVKGTGDGFFLAFDQAAAAIDAAIAIQRRLADQRRTQGFAPAVRIGLHRGRANRAGQDYIGGGVNQAARISAAAAGGEILVSASTLQTARRRFGEMGRRTAELKGISKPVEVVSIAW